MGEKARFEFTVDDLIDVGERVLARSRVVRRMRRGGTIISALAIAAIAFALIPLLLPGLSLQGRLAVAAVAGAISVGTYPSMRRSMVRDKLRSFWKEKLQGEGPFTCEVELTPEGITTRQLSTTISILWSQVESVAEVPEGIEIWGRNAGLIVVRERAFASPEAKRRFAETIRASLVP